jgi:hypothetical protein
VSDRSGDALDRAQLAVCQRGGEVAGFRLEVGDEGLQSDRAGGKVTSVRIVAAAPATVSAARAPAEPGPGGLALLVHPLGGHRLGGESEHVAVELRVPHLCVADPVRVRADLDVVDDGVLVGQHLVAPEYDRYVLIASERSAVVPPVGFGSR